MKTAHMALCNGRHAIPDAVDGSVFEHEIADPTDVAGMEAKAHARLFDMDITSLELYVTGLTIALIATINACKKLDISVVLWHFDRNTGAYYKQDVL